MPLPPQPERYGAALLDHGWFDAFETSAEDQRRSDLYRQRDRAEALRAASASPEQFYRSLKMEAAFAPIDAGSLSRAAQLVQRTNQFNATTIRYSASQLRALLDDPNWIVEGVRLRDRFGDNGIVGLVMAQGEEQTLVIDTFVLSCRVIGRTLETTMLAHLCESARDRGARVLVGRIVPTARNAPVRDLFERHGFEREDRDTDDETWWRLDVQERPVEFPPWIGVGTMVETVGQ